MKGYIIYNPSFYSDGVKYQTEELKKAFSEMGILASVISQSDFTVGISGGKARTTLPKADFIVYLSKDVLTAKILEKCGYRLFNSAFCIEVCDDKALTYSVLESLSVPVVDALFAPRLYNGKDDEKYLLAVESELGYPIVAKLCKSSLGQGVFLAKDREELFSVSEKIGDRPHLYQKFYGRGGEDIRIIVVGGKAVASMKRVNENDFRSNVELGGRGEAYAPTKEEIEVAERSARAVKADYAGVDILVFDGKPAVCEVNSNAFFKEITKISGKSIAKNYVSHVIDELNGLQNP